MIYIRILITFLISEKEHPASYWVNPIAQDLVKHQDSH